MSSPSAYNWVRKFVELGRRDAIISNQANMWRYRLSPVHYRSGLKGNMTAISAIKRLEDARGHGLFIPSTLRREVRQALQRDLSALTARSELREPYKAHVMRRLKELKRLPDGSLASGGPIHNLTGKEMRNQPSWGAYPTLDKLPLRRRAQQLRKPMSLSQALRHVMEQGEPLRKVEERLVETWGHPNRQTQAALAEALR